MTRIIINNPGMNITILALTIYSELQSNSCISMLDINWKYSININNIAMANFIHMLQN